MAGSGSPTGVEMPAEVEVIVSDEQTEVAIDAQRWESLAHDVLTSEGRTGELTLTFVDAVTIAELNAEHMGQSGPTDVLSFPLDALDDDPPLVDAGPLLLGDVVVCPEVAAAGAPHHAGTLDDELALLVVHGILHVLGHDHQHQEDTAHMRARELELLERHHWQGPAPAGFRQVHADEMSDGSGDDSGDGVS